MPAGLATGLGVAAADGTYALIVALGATAFAGALESHGDALRVLGGLALFLLGLKSIFQAGACTQADGAEQQRRSRLVGGTLSAYLLTMANPATIAAFGAVATAVGLETVGASLPAALLFAIGLFTGSFGWWAVLSLSVALMRHRLADSAVVWLNRIAGSILALAGLWLAALGGGLL